MNITESAPLSLPTLVLNLLLGLFLSLLLAWYYQVKGHSLSNRSKFSRNIPMLTVITLLVISIVKSSLALSLGLVGALSIVRFRTAIKDPEELIYLFFSIAIGLGMGADQRVPTLAAYALIMAYLIVREYFEGRMNTSSGNTLFFSLVLPASFGSVEDVFAVLNPAMNESFDEIDFRRVDVTGDEIQFVFYIKSNHPQAVINFTDKIQTSLSGAKISFVEQTNLLGG